MLITPQQIEQNVFSENESNSQRGTFPILTEHFTNNLIWIVFCFALRQNIIFLNSGYYPPKSQRLEGIFPKCARLSMF